MSWIQVRFHTQIKSQEKLEDALLAAGAISITYQDAADQPILEPGLNETPLWNELILTALFHADADIKAIIHFTESEFGEKLPDHKVEILEDKDWVREWMESYQPIRFGERLWICPTWQSPPDPKAINLLLDPGMAFGTGTHPTTAMCMQYLDKIDIAGKTVIDYGCGSGILAIASLLLGAKSAIGIDIDPQAITASNENAARNNISKNALRLFLPDDAPICKADLVLANILAGPLVELAPMLTDQVQPGGKIILSGVIETQKEAIIAAYPAFEWLDINQQEEWLCFLGVKAD